MQDFTKAELHFKKIRPLNNEGKNSSVFIGKDLQLDAELVVKEIPKVDFVDSGSWFNEAKVMYNNQHPNIVPVQYSCQDQDNIFVSMPYFSKGSLNSIIESRSLLLSEILKYSIDILSGLQFIHSKGLVHFDVKPTNILLAESDKAMLTDFGLAKYLNPYSNTAIPDQVYTVHVTPENIQTIHLTHQSDIYQAALTVYRLCNGNNFYYRQLDKYTKGGNFDRVEFENDVLTGRFPDRAAYLPHIPQKLKNYIKKALKPDPADRYNSALDFSNDLAKIEVFFDWKYFPAVNKHIWTSSDESKNYLVEHIVNPDGTYNLIVSKKRIQAANFKRITKFCSKKLVASKSFKVLKTVLNSNSL